MAWQLLAKSPWAELTLSWASLASCAGCRDRNDGAERGENKTIKPKSTSASRPTVIVRGPRFPLEDPPRKGPAPRSHPPEYDQPGRERHNGGDPQYQRGRDGVLFT